MINFNMLFLKQMDIMNRNPSANKPMEMQTLIIPHMLAIWMSLQITMECASRSGLPGILTMMQVPISNRNNLFYATAVNLDFHAILP